MAGRIRRHRPLFTLVAFGVLVGAVLAASLASGQATETPRRGGVLLAVIGADAPSLDLWVAPPSHFINQKLQDVWLSED